MGGNSESAYEMIVMRITISLTLIDGLFSFTKSNIFF